MRLKTHLLTSAIGALALYPRSPRRAALFALGGVALDVDHFVLYALRSGDWNPLGAMRYNRYRNRPIRRGDTRPRYGPLRSILHHAQFTLPLVWALGAARPRLRPLALGLTMHLALDANQWLEWDWRVWRRAQGRCDRCGATDRALTIHIRRPVSQGGSFWASDNRAAWCAPCARDGHVW